ncbi:hypothetical protein WKR88_22810 [Trinickia caryophylli]|uniref:Dihydroorotate dehydrogenase n=1 Tax=Trinickia caryophylli TaxID=28094 RepID=A0A1X7FIW0_TRICW|nr:hypothetical protein [Trinickia caryophylli]PMS13214.1 dihydroorotate dehydrogenase [Trinickia caryophylli]TRX19257.1 dihydroorotate dehydrogenase [Trinickia caryophylli]WQE13440.1 hypothetical protein U0034_08775 [Trinickia caryophylli]SMF52782.1 Dihydroorotate dehydrogenase [Trinickia caryophylli]GLU34036.1 hypothetical protein Busp01_38780 [Trinickia caryophylli]
MNNCEWLARIGLAGGIDKDGSRAAELLATGFHSVEFGTVACHGERGGHPDVLALAARLLALAPSERGSARIGIGIGMRAEAGPGILPADWVRGLHEGWAAADYLSFNLSARRYRDLLDARYAPLLLRAFATVVAARDERARADGRRVAAALKIPLGNDDSFPLTTAEAAADAGFDAVIAVLPEGAGRIERLRLLTRRLRGKAAVVAVGGIRTAGDVVAVHKAGAQGAQVHTAYSELGARCFSTLCDASAG